MEKNEEFFKNNNYNKEVDTSRPDIVKIIMNLKKYWDEIEKQIVILLGYIFKL